MLLIRLFTGRRAASIAFDSVWCLISFGCLVLFWLWISGIICPKHQKGIDIFKNCVSRNKSLLDNLIDELAYFSSRLHFVNLLPNSSHRLSFISELSTVPWRGDKSHCHMGLSYCLFQWDIIVMYFLICIATSANLYFGSCLSRWVIFTTYLPTWSDVVIH